MEDGERRSHTPKKANLRIAMSIQARTNTALDSTHGQTGSFSPRRTSWETIVSRVLLFLFILKGFYAESPSRFYLGALNSGRPKQPISFLLSSWTVTWAYLKGFFIICI